jgi:type I restriction enzyme, S subunit
VSIPHVDEQRAIASVLEDADREIESMKQRLAKAKAVKQGMMQELLTGRTRLPVEEGEA